MARYIMGNKVYDTRNAEMVAEGYLTEPNSLIPRLYCNISTELWFTKKRNWFFVLTGDYNKSRVASKEDAEIFLKKHNYDKYVMFFGELEEA